MAMLLMSGPSCDMLMVMLLMSGPSCDMLRVGVRVRVRHGAAVVAKRG
jgi:hypothetical protein